MAKRKRRKHRMSAKYVTFKQQKPKSIIPPTLSTKTLTRETKTDFKAVRNTIRRLYSEQLKTTPTIPTPKEYKPTRKKNRKEARQKRKEKKQKRKQQLQQKPPQQTEPQIIDYEDYTIDAETGEILDYDDSENYFDQLEAELMQVYQQILDEYSWDEHVYQRFSSIDRAMYWLSDARQLPYDVKQTLMKALEQSVHLEEVHSILAYRYYEEMVNASEDIASTIQAVVESFL